MKKKIGVIGGGPVGLTLAAHLINGGHEVTICEISSVIREAILKNGIHIEGCKKLSAPVQNTVQDVSAFSDLDLDIIFVAVKATALSLISPVLKSFHNGHTQVISWQNGIDTESILMRDLGKNHVYRGIINHGVSFLAIGKVFMPFEKPHYLVEMDTHAKKSAEDIAKLLTDAGLITNTAEHYRNIIWSKTILNASVNGFCALTSMNMHEACQDEYARIFMNAILKESIKVARANEITLGFDFFSECQEFIKKLGEHKPSMLLDMENGARTEIDFINVKIQEYGQLADVPTPYNDALIALIKCKERKILSLRNT